MIKRLAIILFLGLSLLQGAFAANGLSQTHEIATEDSPTDGSQLVFFSRPIVTFRSENQGIAPADRVKRARARIHEQLTKSGAHVVTTKSDPSGVQIQIDGATSFVLLTADLDPASEMSIEDGAVRAAQALTLAIRESQESKSLEVMFLALVKAFTASLAAYGLYRLIRKMRRAVQVRLLKFAATHSTKLHVAGVALLRRDRLVTAVRVMITVVNQLVLLVLTVEWLSFTLRCFPFSRAWGESLSSLLLELATPLLHSAWGAIPELLTALLIFYIGYLLSRAIDRFFVDVQNGLVQLSWLDADVAAPTRRIAKVVVALFTLAMAYPYLPGSDTEAFKGLSVLAGLMLSLGASSLVGQAASGLILTYGRAFRKGEFVRVAEQEGTVTEMGIFTTRIRTGLGEELTISNASILGGTTRNYSRAVNGKGFVLDTTVTIGYDTPWRQVNAMLMEAARRTQGVLHKPEPKVFQTALSDWYPAYRLVCHAIPEGPMPRAIVLSDLHANIQDVFNECGVQIMSPHYIQDPVAPKVAPPGDWSTHDFEKRSTKE